MIRTRGRSRMLAVATALAVALVGACAPPPAPDLGPDPNSFPRAAERAYVEPGPHAVGVRTLDLGDRQVEVWYPVDPAAVEGADAEAYAIRDFLSPEARSRLDAEINPLFETGAHRDAPAVAAPPGGFPLVLFSHGAFGYRLQSTFLTTHLASWGFVVASPDFLERGLQQFLGDPVAAPKSNEAVLDLTIARMETANASGPLAGRIDSSSVYPIGHSAGGSASLAYARYRPSRVPVFIPMASGIPFALPGNVPDGPAVSWIAGVNDQVAQLQGVINAYNVSPGARRLIAIEGAGHNNAFTDICEIAKEQGGVIGLAILAGLPIPDSLAFLGNDGCLAPNLPSEQVWPVVRHAVTAELRYRSGLDPEPVGLGDAAFAGFPGVRVIYQHAP